MSPFDCLERLERNNILVTCAKFYEKFRACSRLICLHGNGDCAKRLFVNDDTFYIIIAFFFLKFLFKLHIKATPTALHINSLLIA